MTKRILLCDDEIHILRAAEFKLRRAGYEVRIAGDGQEAWEAIQTELPTMESPSARPAMTQKTFSPPTVSRPPPPSPGPTRAATPAPASARRRPGGRRT